MFGHGPAIVERLLSGHAIRDDARAVGRPLGAAAESAVRRDPLQASPVGMHQVEIDEMKMFPATMRERQIARPI